MNLVNRNRRKYQHGDALFTAVIFALIISVLVAGFGTVSVSYYQRSSRDEDYASALYMAEAGINYELNQISLNASNADLPSSRAPNGNTYSLGTGSFTVACEGSGQTAWNESTIPLNIVSIGTINGVSRTITISATGGASNGKYALFGVELGTQTSIMNGHVQVNGDVGTNGQLAFNGNVGVAGNVIFNGPGSGWQSTPTNSYTTVYNPSPINWPTVDQIANKQYPSGGLSYVATHNDNSMSNPPITSNTVLLNGNGNMTFYGKPGGANYYLTSLTCNGNSQIYFDNTNGPVTIWVGPDNVSGTFVFNGGSSAKPLNSDNPNNPPVKIYIATNNDVIQNGNTTLDAGIYNVNGTGSGRVIFNGNPTVNGSVIANVFTLNGTPIINYTPGYFGSSNPGYYGFNNNYQEGPSWDVQN